ncbi:MFS transporter [Pigmentiphaga soli]|uniref:MFS transporter n=1 Tax=Pigmentiphaga soli TaxID=1007095 RepID=UPI0031E51857
MPAFGPGLFYGVGNGAMMPVIALSARELGASVATAGVIVALFGIGSLLSNIPAALITARYGERRSMAGAALFSVIAMLVCIFAPHALVLAAGVFATGMAASVFILARQTYLIEAVPAVLRARALSTLAGANRIGVFIGPFLGALLIKFIGLDGGYWVTLGAMVVAGAIALSAPDLSHEGPLPEAARVKRPMREVIRDSRLVLLTLGGGVLLLSAVRASRQVVLPLWADHLGMDAATNSLIYGLAAAVDMTVFYPAGAVMDRHGRMWIAVPSAVLMGLALIGIALTGGATSFIVLALLLGLGNGIGSGIVMTLGADSAPRAERTEFLGVWRVIADLGNSAGPVFLSIITAVASLAAGVAATGVVGLAAAAVFWRWLPHGSAAGKQ